MLLTDRFVYIHQPKTGGTFVTDVLERVAGVKGGPRSLLRRVFGSDDAAFANANKHGTCDQIPEGFRDKPIIATIRNPWSRYVSQYHFGWWKEYPPGDDEVSLIRERFPSYPDLSFPEFLDLFHFHHQRLDGSPLAPEDEHGFQSRQFVRFYVRDAHAVYPTIDDAWIAERRWETHLYPVRFLRQDRLNQDLHDVLAEFGYPEEKLAFILDEDRILPRTPRSGSKAKRHWSEYYTPELRATLEHRERLLLAVFPDFGFKERSSSA